VDYADLAIIDLSKAQTPEGLKELSEKVTKAMHNEGFFYVINHGYTQEQVGLADCAALRCSFTPSGRPTEYSA
jgi:isopenicillin N synthase-like dioxygenase